MRITALALEEARGWPELHLSHVDSGLNVFYGAAGSAKTTVADLVAHVLYGRRLTPPSGIAGFSPAGEVTVESRGNAYRLRRRYEEGATGRLTVSALDGSAVDRDTVRGLVHGLRPSLLSELYVATFSEPSRLGGLLSDWSIDEFQAAIGVDFDRPASQAALVQQRDALAEQLEACITSQRQQGRELDARWQELDRLIHERKQELEQLRDRLRGVETELAEIESWLRCRQTEGSNGRLQMVEAAEWEPRFADFDEQIDRWRAALAELERRQADVRAELAQLRPQENCWELTLVDQRTCLAATRQLLADLEGEVARLARANQSDECVCGEAHPRLRPVVATLRQQLDRLDGLTELQQQACRTAELADEEMHLARSQTEIRGQLDHWLDRRQTLDRVTRRCSTADDSVAPRAITGADSERQATARRFELWEERGRLQTRITELKPQLRELRAERDVVEYRRTEILSPRTIRELERKLADVQQELERAAEARTRHATTGRTADAAMRASEFLAQITDGDLVQLRLPGPARDAQVVNRAGVSRPLEFLLPKERNQIGLSLCLALASLAAEQGIRLPIVLDEPFERMDLRATTALAAVLVEFGRRGHQLLLFTAQPAAIERFAALGTTRHKMAELFRTAAEQPLELVAATTSDGVARPRRVRRRATAKRGDQSAQASRREAG